MAVAASTGIPDARAGDSIQQAPLRLRVDALAGSTGATIAALIATDLQASGAFVLTNDPAGVHSVGGRVTGSRLEGQLLDPAGTPLLETVYDGPDLRRGAHELADDIVFALAGHPGIATSRIAFVSDATGRPEIYVCEADGRERRRVTYDGALASHPSIDRTGSLLTYSSHAGLHSEIYLLDLMGGARRRLVASPGGSGGAALSPDGRRLALNATLGGWSSVTVMDIDGSNPRRMARDRWVSSSPAWSPDGQRVVFACDEGDGDGPHLREGRAGHRSKRLALGSGPAFSPDWSPDGHQLVFVTEHRGETWLALWERATSRVRLLGPGRDPCWGADSRHILFSTGAELVTLHTDSGQRRTIVENFGRLSEPTWTK